MTLHTSRTKPLQRSRNRALALVGAAGLIAVPLAVGGGGSAQATGIPGLSDWPSYNYNLANTRANVTEFQINPSNEGKLKVKWKATDLKGDTSTPAVYAGVVYTGAWDGTVRAYNEFTGKLLWKTLVTAGYPGNNHGMVDPSPTVKDNMVFEATGEGYTVALNADTGKLIWKTLTNSNKSAHTFSSPTVVDGRVLIGNASTEVFSTTSGPFTSRGGVTSLDEKTGAVQWNWYDADGSTDPNGTASGAGGSVWSSAAVDTGLHMMYIGTGQNVSAPTSQYEDSLVALDYTTGKLVWSHQYEANDIYRLFLLPWGHDSDLGASPNLFTTSTGVAAVGAASKDGSYITFNRKTGEPLWGKNFSHYSHLGGIMQTAAYHNNTLFITANTVPDDLLYEDDANTTTLFAVNATTGAILWQTKPMVSLSIGAVTWANGVLYVPTVKGGLYTFKDTDGTPLTELKPSGVDTGTSVNDLGGGATVANGMVFSGYGFWFYAPATTQTDTGGLTAYGF